MIFSGRKDPDSTKIKEHMKHTLLILFISIAFGNTTQLYAQTWNWPEDKSKAEEKNVVYSDALKAKNYRVAANNLSWLLINAPDLNPSIYINGNKIYEGLEEEETDPELKKVYADSSLIMYDLRIQYFNEKKDVLNRKAYDAYKYWKDRKDRYGDLFELFKETFELNGNDVFDNNLVAYLDAVRRYKATGGEVSDEEVIDIYFKIGEVIDYKIANGGKADRLEKYKDNLDKILVATVNVDCDFVEKNLCPKMNSNPEDIKLAQKVFQLLLTGKCSDSPCFVESAKLVYAKEPAIGLATVIAKKEATEGNMDEAIKYYEEGLGLTEDNLRKAEIYQDMANLFLAKGLKTKAREFARASLREDPSNKEVWNVIAQAYFNSYDDCRKGESRVEDRGVFLAAYEAYQRAGNSAGMKSAEAQFPSSEEIFTEAKEEGDTFTIGCWINETVTIRKRPAN
jgi:tetratricopeptide (TPR) repeat protein